MEARVGHVLRVTQLVGAGLKTSRSCIAKQPFNWRELRITGAFEQTPSPIQWVGASTRFWRDPVMRGPEFTGGRLGSDWGASGCVPSAAAGGPGRGSVLCG